MDLKKIYGKLLWNNSMSTFCRAKAHQTVIDYFSITVHNIIFILFYIIV